MRHTTGMVLVRSAICSHGKCRRVHVPSSLHCDSSNCKDALAEGLIRFPPAAVQSWAQCHGGVRAALALPEAPPEGPLRDALATVLRQRPSTSVAMDLG